MIRDLDLIDKLNDLRDILGLLSVAAQSLGMKHERDPFGRGILTAQDMLEEIAAIIDPHEPPEEQTERGPRADNVPS
ncbi:hypothetical protein QD460_24405 [Rhizobium jaguaris]|uniref:hypothetical protein n=1 Tax=Rhizobium jaguaris TaxID=1312183 RepID=UPI0039BF0518